ncbi:CU044_2847 family protein [Streptomyces sp. NBC_00140]|uniref:CU044_2847 family protein n=1 Tax=Streptomyces sp. NBC_00140 TaxID=2975664 RepID=UPI002259593E|nr:CU044_2847 family protein [Streptomyces sp. NBC_00140]MCX5330652.1 CU044_2847 family protein [Streptomyces sp. NBC_00140]
MTIVTRTAVEGLDGPIYVEVDAAPAADGLGEVFEGIDTRGGAADRVLELTRNVYQDGLELARRCAVQAARQLGDLGQGLKPDEVELQLSIKLDAELGAVLVKSGAEAQLQVTFRWTPDSAS